MTYFNETDTLSYKLEALKASPELAKNDPNILTAKQWLEKKVKRYPIRFARGFKRGKATYFHKEQTVPVYSEAQAVPSVDAYPIKDIYKEKRYYYEDECELKKTRKKWWSENKRIVKSGAKPDEERNGFNHLTKKKFKFKLYLQSNTFVPKGSTKNNKKGKQNG